MFEENPHSSSNPLSLQDIKEKIKQVLQILNKNPDTVQRIQLFGKKPEDWTSEHQNIQNTIVIELRKAKYFVRESRENGLIEISAK